MKMYPIHESLPAAADILKIMLLGFVVGWKPCSILQSCIGNKENPEEWLTEIQLPIE